MKKIPWHNPAQQTPPEGYRLLIPEEVDGRFNSKKLTTIRIYDAHRAVWTMSCYVIKADLLSMSYADPIDTPLPEGYTLIDGDVWQREEAPKPLMALDAEPMFKDPVEEFVKARNAEKPDTWLLGHNPEKVMTATEAMVAQLQPELLTKWQEELRKVLFPLIGKAFEVAHRELLDENQRLKNQLADAQATLKSIRSLLP
jgi:hypothetical protein